MTAAKRSSDAALSIGARGRHRRHADRTSSFEKNNRHWGIKVQGVGQRAVRQVSYELA
jgi:hypothetical protein